MCLKIFSSQILLQLEVAFREHKPNSHISEKLQVEWSFSFSTDSKRYAVHMEVCSLEVLDVLGKAQTQRGVTWLCRRGSVIED